MCPPRKIFAKRATKKINQLHRSRHPDQRLGLAPPDFDRATQLMLHASNAATAAPRIHGHLRRPRAGPLCSRSSVNFHSYPLERRHDSMSVTSTVP